MPSLHSFALRCLRSDPQTGSNYAILKRCAGSWKRDRTTLSLRWCYFSNSVPLQQTRLASSASSGRWKTRQGSDQFAREAKVQGLKSRAAFKLLQINDKHKLFKKGNTVVDLVSLTSLRLSHANVRQGFAPGSWSQVALNRTQPDGRVIGVDILPTQPPTGVSTIQGDFLSPQIQEEVRSYVLDPERGRPKNKNLFISTGDDDELASESEAISEESYLESHVADGADPDALVGNGRVVDVVLSDMCEPWAQTTGFGKRSISNPYLRMMNTSGVPFRDHAGSMDLCYAALNFCWDTLKVGGHFVCKFYQGGEDKVLEKRLKRLFEKVHREKPPASRDVSNHLLTASACLTSL